MDTTPKGNRLHIGLFGRTNVGKSSLMNLLLGEDLAITSPVAGTTTDVVEKAAELLPIGPVLFLDTAGLNDTSTLAEQRLKKTAKIYERADVILLVTEPEVWTAFEDDVLAKAAEKRIPVVAVINKIDLAKPTPVFIEQLKKKCGRVIEVAGTDLSGRDGYVNALKAQLIEAAPDDIIQNPTLAGDLVRPGGLAVLVVPIDLQAPKGRLILPQVQTIRDLLDNDAAAVVVKERELSPMLANLKEPPEIVICDSQAILKVTADVPASIKTTTFSILFARQKGDLAAAAQGAAAIDDLKPGDRVLIAEACSHHALEDDIGRVKIPRWLRQYVGAEIKADVFAGRDYPENLSEYKLVIHCGACMLNRREMLSRIQKAREAGVPITNFGVAISMLQGVIKRALEPFPAALTAFERQLNARKAGGKQGLA
ncbi:MAG TPA: [FeFe] hydrogenase H-cluster maturation GTPase HydF [Deltaproteobacteria bacterium]|nr:[FeFe] hydrogenase H-cluster maturation GTPase HydF [Deltaproteobacteria bacterium]